MSFRSLSLAFALALPAASFAQLATNGNQYFQQGFEGLADQAEQNDNLGWAVAIGDFDGDGIMDAAVGAPGEDDGKGLVHVLFGAVEGLTVIDSQVWKPGVPENVWGNWENGDLSGSALAAGDFNGDGYDDLAIGTPGEDNARGSVNILYGSQGDGLTLNGVSGFSQQGLAGGGPDNGDQFGGSLASGDFNGDGFDDLIVGSPGEANSGGLVHILYGSNVGLSTNGNQRWRQGEDNIPGSRENGDSFGFAVASGDFNNDGFADVVIGTPGDDNGRGTLQVLFGSGSGIGSGGNQRWAQGGGGLPDEQETGDVFGISLATGDFNGDGFADIAAGSTGEDNGRGDVMIILGSSTGPNGAGSQRWRQATDGLPDERESGDNFGRAVAAGDFNLDGFDDLAIGVPGENSGRGMVHVLYGMSTGLSSAGNQVYMQGFEGLEGETRNNDALGYVLAAGDFGGDFASDLLLGVPFEDNGGRWGVFQTLLGNQKPTINAVVSAGLGRPSITTLSPNTLATAFGVGLYESASGRGVGPADLDNGALPTLLDRTCIEIDGQRTPVLFLRNDQVNFQVRSSVNGQMQVRLIRNCGEYYELRGDAVSVPVAPVSPDFFAYDIDQDGTKIVAARNATTSKRVGPTTLGAEFEPALPGHIVELYVTGLGLTNPPVAAGALPGSAANAPSVTALIDGLQAEVQYAGVAPGFAGLYQVNVVIPVTPNVGIVPISLTSSGGGPAATTPSTSFVAVQ